MNNVYKGLVNYVIYERNVFFILEIFSLFSKRSVLGFLYFNAKKLLVCMIYNSVFQHCAVSNVTLNIQMTVLILQAGAWPLSAPSSTPISGQFNFINNVIFYEFSNVKIFQKEKCVPF